MIDRTAFFAEVRSRLFAGRLTQSQVDGINAIVDGWQRRGGADDRKLAYCLATPYHETGRAMVPIREKGTGDGPDPDKWDDYLEKYDTGRLAAALGNTLAADGDGVLYCGRGLVQITGHRNYARMDAEPSVRKIIERKYPGKSLMTHPDLALDSEIAAEIMFVGMEKGTFTGKKLSDYFHGSVADWRNARRIINGTDKAAAIAGYGTTFYTALLAASKNT